MGDMVKLGRFSIGVGDRFGMEGGAQIKAAQELLAKGVEVSLVWNKSNREHTIIGTVPAMVRKAADAAVASSGWKGQYFCDADHIGLKVVDPFIEPCDFFTLDVADFIGEAAPGPAVEAFAAKHGDLVGKISIPGLPGPISITAESLHKVAQRYLLAATEAGKIYKHIASKKAAGTFVIEVSMDETAEPQTPDELLIILAAIADEGIPASTIAPKFSGRFNKGVDYVGSVDAFAKEFEADVCVAAYAAKAFGLPAGLKLSVHSGSDKFSLYPRIGAIVKKHGAGLHLKTAGTSWLEELVGLAEAGGKSLEMAKEIYVRALSRSRELIAPYATVVDIDPFKLPKPETVQAWTSQEYAEALRHVQANPRFNPDFRQLLHVAFKVAAELGKEYLNALVESRSHIEKNVTENLFDRHLKPIFLG
jgi:hypothetical protein